MSEELRTLRAYRALIKARLECGCLMTEKDCGLHGPRDVADVMLVSCIFMSEHVRHYGVPVMKTAPAALEGVAKVFTGFGVQPNWQKPEPSPHEERAQLLGASPAAPRAEWRPKYAVGDQVRIKAAGQLATIMFIAPRIASEEPVYDCGIYGLELEHNLEPAPWKLPEPPEGMKYYRPDWTQDMLPEGYRPRLQGERVLYNDEMWETVPGRWIRVCGASDEYLHTKHVRTQRPLPAPSTPDTEEEPNNFLRAINQRDEALQERDAALARASEAEIQRDKAIDNQNGFYAHLKKVQMELAAALTRLAESWKSRDRWKSAAEEARADANTRGIEIQSLRASVPVWVPTKDRKPTREDGDEDGAVWVLDADGRALCCHWTSVEQDSWQHWMPCIPLPPLPVETEEGEKAAWLASQSEQHRATLEWYGIVDAAWQAALRSKKDPS